MDLSHAQIETLAHQAAMVALATRGLHMVVGPDLVNEVAALATAAGELSNALGELVESTTRAPGAPMRAAGPGG